MGTTVTVASSTRRDERIVFGHVGDSRAYRLRGDGLEQITTDHSLVAELVESGVSPPRRRSGIHNARRSRERSEPSAPSRWTSSPCPQSPGDLVLLCSDGLTDMLSRTRSRRCSSRRTAIPRPRPTASSRPRTRTGEDNITVVLFEIVEGEPRSGDGDYPALADDETDTTSADDVSRHGAGSGGQLAALIAHRHGHRGALVPPGASVGERGGAALRTSSSPVSSPAWRSRRSRSHGTPSCPPG